MCIRDRRNDSDPNGNALTAILVSGPSSAAAFTLNANGTFSYTHNNGAATSDSFTYRASDGVNLSNIVTASITITPPASGTTASFQDGIGGYTGTRDTTIKAGGANSNYGTVNTVDAHGNPDKGSLVSWNIASIPTNAVVQAASKLIVIVAGTLVVKFASTVFARSTPICCAPADPHVDEVLARFHVACDSFQLRSMA